MIYPGIVLDIHFVLALTSTLQFLRVGYTSLKL